MVVLQSLSSWVLSNMSKKKNPRTPPPEVQEIMEASKGVDVRDPEQLAKLLELVEKHRALFETEAETKTDNSEQE